MMSFGPLTLAAPAVLAGLAALPLLWWLIRRLPPPTKRVVFPAVRLLGPVVEEPPPQARPPWWLVALRLGAVTAVLLGLAGPRWNPTPDAPAPQRLLIVMDNGWQSAPGWPEMVSAARARIEALEEGKARQHGRGGKRQRAERHHRRAPPPALVPPIKAAMAASASCTGLSVRCSR